MSTEVPQHLKNSHDAIRLFYTILLTVGVSQAVLEFINVEEGGRSVFELLSPELLVLLLYLMVMIRFFLGGVRHLDFVYLEESEEGNILKGLEQPGYRFADFLLLTSDALILIYVGTSIGSYFQFITAMTVLLLIDAIWSLAINSIYDLETLYPSSSPEAFWGKNNSIHAVLLLVILLFNNIPVLPYWLIVGTGFLLIFTNSVFDLYYTLEYYFPTVQSQGS